MVKPQAYHEENICTSGQQKVPSFWIEKSIFFPLKGTFFTLGLMVNEAISSDQYHNTLVSWGNKFSFYETELYLKN